jgi:hypothetical protein
LSVIQFRRYKYVRGNRSVIIIISQTSVIKALLLLSFVRLVKQYVKERECKKRIDIRFSFLKVCVNKFSII